MFLKAQIARVFFVMSLIAGPLAAQDALPETPPELRDFRLDPQRPASAPPTPTIEPQPTAPAPTAQPPQTETPARRESATSRPQTRSNVTDRSNAPAKAPAAATPSGPVAGETAASDADSETPDDFGAEVKSTAPRQTEAAPDITTKAEPDTVSWWTIAAGLGAGAVLLIGLWYFRRRTRTPTEEFAETTEPVAEDSPAEIAVIAPAATSAPLTAKTSPRPRLALSFIPEKATLSFAALTVKGQLRLVNEGDAAANDMQFRASLLSASADQAKAIDAFHGGAFDISVKPLGDALPGEQIAMEIEMSVPVAELESYTIGDKRIFVPLVVANLDYVWDGGQDSARLACIVGREAKPPTQKMAPFRLDLGPRSFAPLGQRPLAS